MQNIIKIITKSVLSTMEHGNCFIDKDDLEDLISTVKRLLIYLEGYKNRLQ